MDLKISKNLLKKYEKELDSDEEFLIRISSGKSLYNENIKYESISRGNFIYPIEKVRKVAEDPYNNFISAKIIGQVNGIKLVEIELERLVPSSNNSYHR